MAKKSNKFLKKQKVAVGVLAVAILAVVGYFLTLVVADSPVISDFVEGEHYILLDNPRRLRGEKIEVMEFFSYGCIHCYNFDPTLTDWVKANNKNVNFVRTPAVANEFWRLLGQNYYTMESLGLLDEYHMAFFREVHDLKRNLSTPERLADYFDGKGVTRAEYLKVFNSTGVKRQIAAADALARRSLVVAVPSMVVNGKYLVRASRSIGIARLLDVVDHLVALELAGEQAPVASEVVGDVQAGG